MSKPLALLFLVLMAASAPAQKVKPLDAEKQHKAIADSSRNSYLAIESTRPGLAEDELITYRAFFISASGLAVAPLQAFDSGKFKVRREADGGEVTITGVVAPHLASGFAIVRTDQRPSAFLTLVPKMGGAKVGEQVAIYRAEKDGGTLTAPIMARRKTPIARSQTYVEILSLGANLGDYGGLHVPMGTPIFDQRGRVTGCLFAPSSSVKQRFLFALPGSALAALLPKNPNGAATIPFPLPKSLGPKDPLAFDATYLYGRSAQVTGNYPEAERLLRKALAREPRSANGWQRLGYTLRARGRKEQAMECFIKAANLAGNLSSFQLDRADQLSLQGEMEAAVDFLRSACETTPDNPDLHRAYAVALRSKKDEAGAEKHLRIATRLAPEVMSGWNLLSKCLAAQGKWDAEKPVSDKIYELDSVYRPR